MAAHAPCPSAFPLAAAPPPGYLCLMLDTRRIEGGAQGVMLMGLAALLAAVLWQVQPWRGASTALRPDTGEAARALDDAGVDAVLSELLLRVYRAFEQEDEGAIYDGLATAVSDDLIAGLYLQRRAAQSTEYQRDGAVEILNVEITDLTVTARDAAGYQAEVTWEVLGVLGHEDHRHERLNAYSARMRIGPARNEWRLTEFDLNRVNREEVPLFFLDSLEIPAVSQ